MRNKTEMKLPEWWAAPEEMWDVDGHCGLVAAWAVLHHFGKSTSVPQLMSACRHTKRHGIFSVNLAAGLKELGLNVSFHTEPDNDIGGFEMRGYRRLKSLGVPVDNALEISDLLTLRRNRRIPIVLYDTASQSGHFSTFAGTRRGLLHLPLAKDRFMSTEEFLAAWTAPQILKQCVVAWE
jgi:hypothetical protein